MWLSFWKSRDRFSLEELRSLTDQLQKILVVNEDNQDFVIEALRSIAELLTYGDQHDASFFDFFMEKQVLPDFVRILKVSKSNNPYLLQLLQTMSILIQNLRRETAISYLFSNEHINYLISSSDFQTEELLSYYISFLRAVSGKLNENTISLLVKTQNDEVVSFPLYVEAVQFAFHEETMIRTAVRAVTLNVFHVGDGGVNRYVTSSPHAEYFSNLISFFRKQCIDLDRLVFSKKPGPDFTSTILSAVDEIEDNLFYFSDVISAGIPDVGKLITDNILQHFILPFLFPSLQKDAVRDLQIGGVTSMYLLSSILRIVKIRDLANTVAAALFCPPEAFLSSGGAKVNGHVPTRTLTHETQHLEDDTSRGMNTGQLRVTVPNPASLLQVRTEDVISPKKNNFESWRLPLREALLSYITSGDDIQVLGSLNVLATLLQTKELDESMLDALGMLPHRKQHIKLLLQALVGEVSGEEQLFSPRSLKDGVNNELDNYLLKLKDQYGVAISFPELGTSPLIRRHQVLDALARLFCRSDISAETLWNGGWLLRQLLPYSEFEFKSHHIKLLKDSYKKSADALLKEIRGVWPDFLITVLYDEWKKCKRAIEASSPSKEPKSILLQNAPSEDKSPSGSSFTAAERMCEKVKVFVLLHQLQIFSLGRALPEQPPIYPPADLPKRTRAITISVDISGPKTNTEISIVDAVPCKIAFERGKERHFFFLAISIGIDGWILLAEEIPLKQQHGVVRIIAPLAGTCPIIHEKHPTWLLLRIRPSTSPFVDPTLTGGHGKNRSKAFVDGRWTLAFKDEETCKSALSMILEEIKYQTDEVERRLKPLLDSETAAEFSISSLHPSEPLPRRLTSFNSL
ncbi:hypothetical protein ACFE04_028979 [Oxalis oulophora]